MFAKNLSRFKSLPKLNLSKWVLIFLILNISSCETIPIKKLKRGIFTSQILEFSKEHQGKLINRDDFNIATYDLNDANLRNKMDRLKFSCKIGDKYYYICQNVAGICRNTGICIKKKRKLFKRNVCIKYKYEVITTDQTGYLVDSSAFCYSELAYNL